MRVALFALLLVQSTSSLEPPLDAVQGAKKARAAQSKQRGSDSLPVAVKLLNTGESEEQATRDAARIQVEHEIAVSALRWTRILGIIAGIQSLIFLLQLFVFGRQATRLRETVDEMKEASKLTRRMLVAEHPPLLTIHSIAIRTPDDGVPVISFCVENRGHSTGTIISTWIKDSVAGGPGSVADEKPGIQDAANLVGSEIRKGGLLEVEHRCVNITSNDIVPMLPGPVPVGAPLVDQVRRVFRRRELYLDGFIGYADETGDIALDWCQFRRLCVPPATDFSVADVE